MERNGSGDDTNASASCFGHLADLLRGEGGCSRGRLFRCRPEAERASGIPEELEERFARFLRILEVVLVEALHEDFPVQRFERDVDPVLVFTHDAREHVVGSEPFFDRDDGNRLVAADAHHGKEGVSAVHDTEVLTFRAEECRRRHGNCVRDVDGFLFHRRCDDGIDRLFLGRFLLAMDAVLQEHAHEGVQFAHPRVAVLRDAEGLLEHLLSGCARRQEPELAGDELGALHRLHHLENAALLSGHVLKRDDDAVRELVVPEFASLELLHVVGRGCDSFGELALVFRLLRFRLVGLLLRFRLDFRLPLGALALAVEGAEVGVKHLLDRLRGPLELRGELADRHFADGVRVDVGPVVHRVSGEFVACLDVDDLDDERLALVGALGVGVQTKSGSVYAREGVVASLLLLDEREDVRVEAFVQLRPVGLFDRGHRGLPVAVLAHVALARPTSFGLFDHVSRATGTGTAVPTLATPLTLVALLLAALGLGHKYSLSRLNFKNHLSED